MSLYRLLSFGTKLFSKKFISGLISTPPNIERHKHYIRSIKRKHIALYVHIPYCLEPLCRFCCFVRYPLRRKADMINYASALLEEIEWYHENLEEASIGSIYFGGGTPTINISVLGELIDSLRSYFGDVPITVESNPRTLVNGEIDELKSLRIKRLSIGIQSFQNWRLKKMGRFSLPVEENKRIIKEALGKFDTVNIDMVWGIPGDTVQSVIYDAVESFKLGVDQVTFYPIMPPPMKSKVMPDYVSLPIREELKLYKALLVTTLSYGYRPDTPWCMSKITKGQQLIDEYITEYYDFVGIGVSSIGKIGNYVYVNHFYPEKYIRSVRKKKLSVTRSIQLGDIDRALFDIQSSLFGLGIRKPVKIISTTSFILWSLVHLLFNTLVSLRDIHENIPLLYALHLIQKTLYTGMNTLREIGMRYKL